MSITRLLVDLVDREIAYWRRPFLSLFASAIPVIGLDVLYDGPSKDLPTRVLLPALLVGAVWGGFVMWRYVRFEILEFRACAALLQKKTRRMLSVTLIQLREADPDCGPAARHPVLVAYRIP